LLNPENLDPLSEKKEPHHSRDWGTAGLGGNGRGAVLKKGKGWSLAANDSRVLYWGDGQPEASSGPGTEKSDQGRNVPEVGKNWGKKSKGSTEGGVWALKRIGRSAEGSHAAESLFRTSPI